MTPFSACVNDWVENFSSLRKKRQQLQSRSSLPQRRLPSRRWCACSPTWRTRPTPKISVCSVRACIRSCVRACAWACARAFVRVRACVCSPRMCVPVLPCSRRVRSVRHGDPLRHCNAHVFRMFGMARVAAGPTLRVSPRAVLAACAPLPPRDRKAQRPTLRTGASKAWGKEALLRRNRADQGCGRVGRRCAHALRQAAPDRPGLDVQDAAAQRRHRLAGAARVLDRARDHVLRVLPLAPADANRGALPLPLRRCRNMLRQSTTCCNIGVCLEDLPALARGKEH